jgi:PAS domain S-box-containing protein
MSDRDTGRLRHHETLLQISSAMTAQLDITTLLAFVIDAAVELSAGNAGVIALRDESGILHIHAAAHIPAIHWHALEPFVSRFQISGYGATENDLQDLRLIIDIPVRHVTALALHYLHTNVGYILVFRSAVNVAFSSDDQHILSAFADQAAIAVTNARLFQTLVREKQHLATIVEQSIDGVMILDGRWRISAFNRAMEHLTGWDRSEAFGRPCAEVVGVETPTGDNLCRVDCPLQRAHIGSTAKAEGWITSRDGRRRYIQSSYTIQRDASNYFLGAFVNIRDITQQRLESETQNTFISVVSHELKTPVSIIRGYAEMLARTDVTWNPDQIQESLRVIIEESDRLTDEINSLLDVSRVQLNALPMELTTWSLYELIEQTCARFEHHATAHGINFDVRVTPDFSPVYADRSRTRLVFENLITNAMKYSPNGGPVRITARSDSGMAIITVSDHGIGVAPEDQNRIFERFYRVDNRLRREQQGFGLGLYLAKAIIEAQHGQIWVESRVNHGSRFSFSLPLAVAKITGETQPIQDMLIDLTKDSDNDGAPR